MNKAVLLTLLVVFLVGFIIGKLIVTAIHHNQQPSPPREYVLEQKAKGITFEF